MNSDTMITETKECPECRGTGKISAQNCRGCNATGQIIIHSHEHRHADTLHDHPHPHDQPHHPGDEVAHDHPHQP